MLTQLSPIFEGTRIQNNWTETSIIAVVAAELLCGYTKVIWISDRKAQISNPHDIRPPPSEKVTDLRFLDKANYFLGHAIIAYVSWKW